MAMRVVGITNPCGWPFGHFRHLPRQSRLPTLVHSFARGLAQERNTTQHKKEHRKEEDTRTLSRKGWKGRGRDRQAAKARAKTQGGQKWKRKHHESKKVSKGSS